MSWKCVLVGLALVLPGTLLSVEGRFSEETSAADTRDGEFLKRLLNYFKQDELLTRQQYDNTRKREETDAFAQDSIPQDVPGPGPNPGVVTEDEAPPPPPSPSAPEKTPKKTDHHKAGGKGRQNVETNLQAKEAHPVALPISQSRHGSGAESGGEAGGLLASNSAFIMVVAGCTVLAAVGIVGAGVCWYKYNTRAKAASNVEYPAYGVTGPTKDRLPSPGDRKLAQSAQMYHYQHQKQQMIAMEKANGDMKHDASDDESEEDNVEGDYTVYECPGLAPTGEMEVKNPLFRGDDTPSTPANDDSQDQPGDH
ncbi:neural proliferation differentiation and control protein 1-like [Littorina saxatilis]|uniref:Neural proliferation differentiation and control protein 1 n=1 Tax=Littorina saxatilis TaxID=31220 RepID=A0AAN9G4I4_9CAEN